MNHKVLFGIALACGSSSLWATEAETWVLSQSKDPVTDLPTASARLLSDDGDARLIFVCSGAGEPVVSLQYLPRRFLGSESKLVIIRFDGEPPITSTSWEYVSKGAFNRIVPEVAALSKKLSENHRIFVRAMNYEDQPVDSSFTSESGKEAINSVLAACKYPLVP